jgi:hypothetical protein
VNRHNANTRYTTTLAGSSRTRVSRRSALANTSSTVPVDQPSEHTQTDHLGQPSGRPSVNIEVCHDSNCGTPITISLKQSVMAATPR